MRLVSLNGKLWRIQRTWGGYNRDPQRTDHDKFNLDILRGSDGCDSGCFRLLAPGVVKADAYAEIEILVNGLARVEAYDIYYSKKGYYCQVQGKRIYLHELLDRQEKTDSAVAISEELWPGDDK